MTSPLANGEPLTRSTCYRCGADGPTVPRPCKARECRSPVCIDLCVECVGQRNSYNRPPAGRTFPEFWPNTHTATWEGISRTALQQMIEQTAVPFSDMYSPDEAEAGAQLTPEVLEAVRQRVISTPLRRDSVASRVMDDAERAGSRLNRAIWGFDGTQFVLDDTLPPFGPVRLEQRTYGESDGSFTPTGDGNDRARQLSQRPDHYRLHPGQCVCGFRSTFLTDMDRHIAGDVIEVANSVPKRWVLCECGESRLCRRVVVAGNQPINWSAEAFDPSRTPSFDDIYLCDTCCERRGIR